MTQRRIQRTMSGGIIYLVHFERPYKHARHYLGWTGNSLIDRFDRHLSNARLRRGSALMRAVLEAGIPFKVVAVRPGDRTLERLLHNRRHGPRLCPICRGVETFETASCALLLEKTSKTGQKTSSTSS